MTRGSPPEPWLVERVRGILAAEPNGGSIDEPALRRAVQAAGVVLDRQALASLLAGLRYELHGLGALEPLVRDPEVTDVLVNGPADVWIDRGSGLIRVPVAFAGEAAVRQLAVRLAAQAGRRLDDAMPWVDARLPGGQRLHAVIPPLAVRGTTISIRVPSRRRFTLADLRAAGTVDDTAASWLAAIVAARMTFLVTGGTLPREKPCNCSRPWRRLNERVSTSLGIFRSVSNVSRAAARRAAANRPQLQAAARAYARAQRAGTKPAVALAAARDLKIEQARAAIADADRLLTEVADD